jgi:hypothetical protein
MKLFLALLAFVAAGVWAEDEVTDLTEASNIKTKEGEVHEPELQITVHIMDVGRLKLNNFSKCKLDQTTLQR